MKPLKIILIVFLALGISSCGSRKSQKTETELKTDVSTYSENSKNSGSNESTVSKTDAKDNTITTETDEGETLTPINPEQPIIKITPDGKATTYKNAVVTIGKKTKQAKKDVSAITTITKHKKDTVAVADKQHKREQKSKHADKSSR
jgi:hypothetical protein